MTIEELVDLAADYQSQSKRMFGVTNDDFRGAFSKLYWEISPNLFVITPLKENTTLEETISKILSYYAVYYNDEGEYWSTFQRMQESPSGKNLAMRRYFEDNPNASPEQVLDFLKEINYDVSILETCSM